MFLLINAVSLSDDENRNWKRNSLLSCSSLQVPLSLELVVFFLPVRSSLSIVHQWLCCPWTPFSNLLHYIPLTAGGGEYSRKLLLGQCLCGKPSASRKSWGVDCSCQRVQLLHWWRYGSESCTFIQNSGSAKECLCRANIHIWIL